MPDEIPEVTEERLIRPFVDMAESVREFVRQAPIASQWSAPAYELMFRHLMDHTVDHPGAAIAPDALAQIVVSIETAASLGQRAPHHLKVETFRAVLGHMLYRMTRPPNDHLGGPHI